MNHGAISPDIAKGLKALRSRIAKAKIPSSKLDETLNVATWNIREFGKKARSEAAIHYIAEILGQFDLVSIAELRDNLGDLERVLTILGPYWRAIYSDSLEDAGGNAERIGFIYDKRAVAFTGFAATATAPRTRSGDVFVAKFDWWREPFMASFSAGSFDFVLLAAHAQWGTAAGRTVELQSLADWVDLKRKEKTFVDKDFVVVGDFNIDTPSQLAALTSKGLQMPAALKGKTYGTNLAQDKRYDQILQYADYPQNFSNQAGILDFYTGGTADLFPGLDKTAFTFQMSDHLPLWMQINTDIEGEQLDEIIKAGK
ncbi:MAG TPA: endonuclease/exonuclease/phosphatase family protein [Burkholderiales bacterium]|nr:endonuclease/exonuclease/phosphatase family protein [Burkholderiales bacterium]